MRLRSSLVASVLLCAGLGATVAGCGGGGGGGVRFSSIVNPAVDATIPALASDLVEGPTHLDASITTTTVTNPRPATAPSLQAISKPASCG